MNDVPQPRRDLIRVLGDWFGEIAVWSHDHRWLVLAGSALLVAGFGWLASGVRFDNSYEAFFDQSDRSYETFLAYQEDFGSDEVSYLLYDAKGAPHGPWNLEVMRAIASLTRALEDEVPFVAEVTSLTNAEFIEGVPDGLEIGGVLDDFPETQEELLLIRDQILRKPMLVGGIASADKTAGAIIVEMDRTAMDPIEELRVDPDGGNRADNLYPQAVKAAIDKILARPEYAEITFHHTGDVPINAAFNTLAPAEAQRGMTLAILVSALLLLLFLRSFLGMAGPIIVVVISVVGVLAVVRALGWDLNLLFVLAPSLIIAVGIADAVHLLSEYRQIRAHSESRREALRETWQLVGPACLLTTLTTSAGFAALLSSPIASMFEFATYCIAGVVIAFVLSLTLLMGLVSFGSDRNPTPAPRGADRFGSVLEWIARFSIRFPNPLLGVFALVFVFSIAGITQLKIESNYLSDFDPKVPVRVATEYADSVMGGTMGLVYLVDTGVAGGIKEPEVLREIERLQNRAAGHSDVVAKAYSIVDVLKDINQSFHEGDPSYYRIPESRELVAQYLLLYESSGGDEAFNYVSPDYSRAAIELRCRWVDSSVVRTLTDDVAQYLEASPVVGATVERTGGAELFDRLMDYIVSSQKRGFLLAFIFIAVMMAIVFQSVKLGFLAMIPNVFPPVAILGVMGWIGMPIDYSKLMIATVAIGIAVDDTIHHMARFRRDFQDSGDYEAALVSSMRAVGRAILITSIALTFAYLSSMSESMRALKLSSLLLAGTVGAALIADFFLMPALVLTFQPFGPPRREAITRPVGESPEVLPAS